MEWLTLDRGHTITESLMHYKYTCHIHLYQDDGGLSSKTLKFILVLQTLQRPSDPNFLVYDSFGMIYVFINLNLFLSRVTHEKSTENIFPE